MATKANMTERFANALAAHQIELLRVASKKTRDVVKFLDTLESDLIRQLKGRALSEAARSRVQRVLDSVRESIRSTYHQMDAEFGSRMRNLVKTEAEVTANIANRLIGVDLYDGVLPNSVVRSLVGDTLIQGAPSEEWWSRQAGDVAFRFGAELRTGIAAGETNAQLISRVLGNEDRPGLLDVARRNAAALVQTSVQTFANRARLESFRQNDDVIAGVQQVSTLDGVTTDICIAYDGQSWDLEGEPINDTELPFENGPPRHWNCRSTLVPITKTWRELGLDIDEIPAATRASMDGQVAEKMTFGDWLETKSEERQNEILGTGKAELWRDGKITLQQLLDQRGNPLTLEALRSRYVS